MNETQVLRTVIGISLLVFTAKLLSGVFNRYKIPSVIGEVLAGIIFGPYAFGGLIYFFGEPIVQLNEMTLSFAFIGGIFVLFAAGLEFTFAEVARAGPASFLIGVFDVGVAFTFGFFVPAWLGYPWTVSVIVATALTATSTAITVKVLQQFNVLHSSEARIMVNAAIMDDILGLAFFSVATSIIFGGEVPPLSIVVLRILLIVLVWFLLLTLTSFFIPRIMKMRIASFDYVGTVEATAIMICFGLAFLTAFLGLSPIVGAFAAGVAIAGSRILSRAKEHIHHLNLIFGTIFFALIGAQINLGVFLRLDYLLFVLLLAVAILTKIVGCGLPSVVYFRSKEKGLRVGYGMISRGEVGLLVAGLGLSAGILEQNIYVLLVATVLATTLVGPFLMKRSFEKPKPP